MLVGIVDRLLGYDIALSYCYKSLVCLAQQHTLDNSIVTQIPLKEHNRQLKYYYYTLVYYTLVQIESLRQCNILTITTGNPLFFNSFIPILCLYKK